ncbi:hypothetical protein HMPREF9622_01645 [Cutibacterium modestum HL037PA3]|nr:hypothetical protein HMPREF9622_01645 [Cutibacterium modestum HL037PA3]EGG26245.1 hypothetical protein PA08_2211 [Cutibacterium modestum P08]
MFTLTALIEPRPGALGSMGWVTFLALLAVLVQKFLRTVGKASHE